MQKPKFRAYDIETKEFSYDYLSTNWILVSIRSPYIKLMQSTNIIDNNHTEMYAGDIVRYKHKTINSYPPDDYYGYVYQHESGKWMFEYEDSFGRKTQLEIYKNRKFLTVVGDIYRNPNWLKGD